MPGGEFTLAYRLDFNATKSPDLFGVEIVSADPYLKVLVCMTPLTDGNHHEATPD
jgi:hypothetical protein